MGIPSYFSYIVKNYNNIIIKLNLSNDYFFLDSNSIVYDSLREINDKYLIEYNNIEFEDKLTNIVCLKIEELYNNIKPKKLLYISFDGVAPVAKLEQQRNRRFKSYVEAKLEGKINENYKKQWDRCSITPGTKFMEKLTIKVKTYFKKIKNIPIIVSSSDEEGEGEHKIFSYIRNNNINKNNNIVVYGLDADLIMLSLNHLNINENIYLYRETPEFIKSIDKNLDPGEKYIMNIPLLGKCIIKEMNFYNKNIGNKDDYRLQDYIFLCFFLGNDFLPHFPSVNIRTNGIDIMINAYKETIGRNNKHLTNGKYINWNNVSLLINYLADNEWDNLIEQTKIRNKQEKRIFKSNTYEEKKMRYLNIPIKNRCIENYIDPYKSRWENRYYETLLHCDYNLYYRKKVCINYLEGLEWTMKYYSGECPDWNWKYNYCYPPLFKDLKKYVPNWECNLIKQNTNKPIKSVIQLAYVLPLNSLKLIGRDNYELLMKKYPEYYDNNAEILWAYCKYMWESHVLLPEIKINNLNELLLKN